MWLFQFDVFVQWFGFWQFMGVMYALMFSLLLVGLVIRRKDEEAFYEVCRIQREIDKAVRDSYDNN